MTMALRREVGVRFFFVSGKCYGAQRSVDFKCTRVPPLKPIRRLDALPDSSRAAYSTERILEESSNQTVTELEEINQNNYYQYLSTAGSNLVVVDVCSDWCGPCKLIYPQLVVMSQEYPDVRFVKFNCSKKNKELGKALGVRVLPTFLMYRNSKKIAEMTGAHAEALRNLVEENL